MHTTSIALLLALAANPPERAIVTETRPMMGSVVSVAIVARDAAEAGRGMEAAFARFERVDAVMNEWRPESPLSRLNAAAGGGWVPLPADLCEVLRLAKAGAAETGGRFDPTWAALSSLWRFDGTARVPSADAVRRACPLVDHEGLRLRPREDGGCDARLLRAGMRVGLGGIAKGWAVDEAAKALRALGFRDFLIQAGGDLYAAGTRGVAPWRIAIRDPDAPDAAGIAALDVRDAAFSTSGDDQHGFSAGGRRWHHVIDPRTCEPAPATRAVTVLSPTAVRAEIASKAAFVEGGAGGLAIARALGVEAVVVTAEGEVLASPGIGPRLVPGSRVIRTVDPLPPAPAAPPDREAAPPPPRPSPEPRAR